MSAPTPEAIEAAAIALWAAARIARSYTWEQCSESTRERYRTEAKVALTAAAPLMEAQAKAEAWDEGYGDCWDFHQSAGQIGRDTNPYRAATIEGNAP